MMGPTALVCMCSEKELKDLSTNLVIETTPEDGMRRSYTSIARYTVNSEEILQVSMLLTLG